MFIAFQKERQNGEVLRGTVDNFKGKTYVSIRVFYQPENSEEWLPGRNGLTVRLDEFDTVKEALAALEPTVRFQLLGSQGKLPGQEKKGRGLPKRRDEEDEQEEQTPPKRKVKKVKKLARR